MVKRKRIFIAVNVPREVKDFFTGLRKKWPELPARWVAPENLHVTLVFLGDVSNEDLGRVRGLAREVAAKHRSFSFRLDEVSYGPDDKLPPRMVWAVGEENTHLSSLARDLEKSLSERIPVRRETRAFRPHITLARIHAMRWRTIELEERPEVVSDIDVEIAVNSIEVMESRLKRSGSEYVALESFPLK